MASLLEKIQTLIAADLNRLVDRALQSNETAVFQHHLRELQRLQEQLNDQLAHLRAEIMQLRQRSDEQQALLVRQDLEVDRLLKDGLYEDALAAQDRLNQTRLAAAHLTAQLEKLDAQYAQMAETQAQLNARITALRQSEPEVESLVGLARAKELTAAAIRSLDDLAGIGDPDVARVVNAIRARLAEAEAQIQQLAQQSLAHGETPEALKRKELESQLAARKARLGLP
jgi:phage shock protein A